MNQQNLEADTNGGIDNGEITDLTKLGFGDRLKLPEEGSSQEFTSVRSPPYKFVSWNCPAEIVFSDYPWGGERTCTTGVETSSFSNSFVRKEQL